MTTPIPQLIYPSFATNYIQLTGSSSAIKAQEKHGQLLIDFYSSLPASKAKHQYATGKWSVQEVLRHLIDTERIFCYRLLSIIREDDQVLPPFDENVYVEKSQAHSIPWSQIQAEWLSSRQSTSIMLSGVQDNEWVRQGRVGDYTICAQSIGLILTGHQLHHLEILKTRYGC
jgi:hypothetical protein